MQEDEQEEDFKVESGEESFPELVARFPPCLIRSQSARDEMMVEIARLESLIRPLGSDESEYLSLLQVLLARYEGPPAKTGALALLEQLLAEHQLRKSDLSRILGKSMSLCSMILNGQRAITREHAVRLGRYFGRGPDLFLV